LTARQVLSRHRPAAKVLHGHKRTLMFLAAPRHDGIGALRHRRADQRHQRSCLGSIVKIQLSSTDFDAAAK
jgi:hypothetical protein